MIFFKILKNKRIKCVAGVPGRVQHEGTTLLEVLHHVELTSVGAVVASNVVSLLHQILGLDGILTHTHVGHGQTT